MSNTMTAAGGGAAASSAHFNERKTDSPRSISGLEEEGENTGGSITAQKSLSHGGGVSG